jgi:hypothetical protein
MTIDTPGEQALQVYGFSRATAFDSSDKKKRTHVIGRADADKLNEGAGDAEAGGTVEPELIGVRPKICLLVFPEHDSLVHLTPSFSRTS